MKDKHLELSGTEQLELFSGVVFELLFFVFEIFLVSVVSAVTRFRLFFFCRPADADSLSLSSI